MTRSIADCSSCMAWSTIGRTASNSSSLNAGDLLRCRVELVLCCPGKASCVICAYQLQIFSWPADLPCKGRQQITTVNCGQFCFAAINIVWHVEARFCPSIMLSNHSGNPSKTCDCYQHRQEDLWSAHPGLIACFNGTEIEATAKSLKWVWGVLWQYVT